MKALTICQPYAELIARGLKVIENRHWPTMYRGPLAIHAGKSRAWLDDTYTEDLGGEQAMTFGAVVAVADLIDCRRITDLPEELQLNEHANGPYCWLLSNVRRIRPVAWRGAQGLFEIPDSALVRGQED